MSAWIARLRLRRDAPARALAPLLLPARAGEREGAAHRLIWTLFGEDAEARRDFLWREEGEGRFMVLSARQPVDAHHLFDLDCKPFAPALMIGDKLRFALRANPVVQRPGPDGRPQRHDLVMDALKSLAPGDRGAAREAATKSVATAWLARQAEQSGFAVETCVPLAYDRVRIPRQGGRPAVFGMLDLEGEVTVTAPETLQAKLLQGFGRARAFGCGLMLIRRA
jgi:CRISPR system Cascade subunit CasE